MMPDAPAPTHPLNGHTSCQWCDYPLHSYAAGPQACPHCDLDCRKGRHCQQCINLRRKGTLDLPPYPTLP